MATHASQNNIAHSGIDYSHPLWILRMVYLLWGIALAGNLLVLDKLQVLLSLGEPLSRALSLSLFVAYVVVAWPASWLVGRVGYKQGMVLGLGLSALGAVLYYPAMDMQQVWLVLAANVLLAIGFAVLQTAGNPYIAVLGTPFMAAGRLAAAHAYLLAPAVLLPVLANRFLFTNTLLPSVQLQQLQLPYLGLAVVLAAVASFLYLYSMPRVGASTKAEKILEKVPSAWRFAHVLLGALAVFMVVGTETTFLQWVQSMPHAATLGLAPWQLLALLVGAAVVARLVGGTGQHEQSWGSKLGDWLYVALLGFAFAKFVVSGFLPFANMALDFDWEGLQRWFFQDLQHPLLFVLMQLVPVLIYSLVWRKGNQVVVAFTSLTLLFLVAVLFAYSAMDIGGDAWALLLGAYGFQYSIALLLPNIIALGLRDMGRSTAEASAIMVMSMVGGYLLPQLALAVSAATPATPELWVGALGLLFVLYYGVDGYRVRQYSFSRPTSDAAVGVDVGAENTNVAVVSRTGQILAEEVLFTRHYTTPEDLVQAINGSVENLLQRIKHPIVLRGLGIGAPNGNYYTGMLDNPINLHYNGQIPLVLLMQRHFKLPIVLTNDANAAAIAEMTYGSAKEMRHFVSISLGNYLGSGLVINRQVVYGQTGHAGELGHVVVQPEGRLCTCGRKGCLQTYVSANGLIRTTQKMLADTIESSKLRDILPGELTGKMIYAAANMGDAVALRAFQKTGEMLGQKLADLVAQLSPEAIFLTGGLANAGELLLEPTRNALKENMLRLFDNDFPLLPSGLKGNATVVGAAALVWEHLAANQTGDAAHLA